MQVVVGIFIEITKYFITKCNNMPQKSPVANHRAGMRNYIFSKIEYLY